VKSILSIHQLWYIPTRPFSAKDLSRGITGQSQRGVILQDELSDMPPCAYEQENPMMYRHRTTKFSAVTVVIFLLLGTANALAQQRVIHWGSTSSGLSSVPELNVVLARISH
jgi:hypothetical protein